MVLSNNRSNFIKLLLITTLVSSCLIDTTNSYKILGLFPHPGHSHFHVFHPIMRELALAGHNVTVLSSFPDLHPPPNYKDLVLSGMPSLTNAIDLSWFRKRRSFGHYMEFFMLYKWGEDSCEHALNSTAMRKLLKSKQQFDVILMEQFNSDCMMGVAHKLQAPVIGLSSCALMPWHYNRIGNPHITSYIPSLFVGYSDKMTFVQRFSNLLTKNVLNIWYQIFNDRAADRLIHKYLGDNIPSVTELAKKTSLIFVNQHYSLSGSKPLSPAVIEIGGIHIGESKSIDQNLKKILDSAEHGVIYVSWGSMIRAETIPIEKREALLKAFGSLKQTVLWKWENETLPNKPANVHVQKWMPQREILCHPKTRVTHGGLLGSSEAAYCGVPVVATPMYGDQFLNSAALVDRGMGKVVHYEDITKKTISNAIQFALDADRQGNAKKVAYSFKNRIETPQKTAVWWVEYVAATGGAPLLKSNSTFLPAYIYYSLDVLAVLLLGLVVLVASWIWVFRRFCGKKAIKSTKEKKN